MMMEAVIDKPSSAGNPCVVGLYKKDGAMYGFVSEIDGDSALINGPFFIFMKQDHRNRTWRGVYAHTHGSGVAHIFYYPHSKTMPSGSGKPAESYEGKNILLGFVALDLVEDDTQKLFTSPYAQEWSVWMKDDQNTLGLNPPTTATPSKFNNAVELHLKYRDFDTTETLVFDNSRGVLDLTDDYNIGRQLNECGECWRKEDIEDYDNWPAKALYPKEVLPDVEQPFGFGPNSKVCEMRCNDGYRLAPGDSGSRECIHW
jgi:hypothetical protein